MFNLMKTYSAWQESIAIPGKRLHYGHYVFKSVTMAQWQGLSGSKLTVPAGADESGIGRSSGNEILAWLSQIEIFSLNILILKYD